MRRGKALTKPGRVVYISRVRLNPYVRLLARGVHQAAPDLVIEHSHFLSLPWLWRHGRHADVLHIHWAEYLYLAPRAWERRRAFLSVMLALLLTRLLNVRTVYTVHNLTPHEVASPYLHRALNALLFRLVDAVHVHDASVAAEVARRFGRRRGVYVIPHGPYFGAYPDTVDRATARATLQARGFPLPEDAFVFLFLGQVRRYKGVERLVAAFRDLDAAHAFLLIVGKAEDVAYAEEVRRLAQADPRIITHLTYVADEDLQFFFHAADVCVLPYRHITTSGAALLAFTFGVPIIAPAIGPFPDLVGEGRGLLYPPEDVDGLREALRVALNGALADAGPRVKAFARSLDWPRLGERHVAVYERVLCRPLRPSPAPSPPPLVCAGREPWEGPWRNRHYLMSRLARRTRVLYLSPRPYLRGVVRAAGRVPWRAALYRPLATCMDLWVLRLPAWAPRSGRRLVRRVSDALARSLIARSLRRVTGCPPAGTAHPPVLWLTAPDQADLIDLVRPQAVVYHVVDDYTAYEAEAADPVRQAWVRERHEALLRRADAVICTHPALAEAARRLNPRVYVVPNAVDWAWVQRAQAFPTLPADLEAIPRPRVGYVGVLNDKIDVALLRRVVDALPEVHLVIVGPEALDRHAGERRLLEHPRVHCLGFRPPEQVPLYMRGLDVALMPYRLNRWTAHIDPLKGYEYFALGLPVVSTPIPAAERWRDLLYVAPPEAFAAAVRDALAEQNPQRREQRRAFARANTWDRRADQVWAILEALLQEKTGGRGR